MNTLIEEKIKYLGGIGAALGGKVTPMTEEQLLAIEKQIGASLPEEYRSFINEHGASKFNTLVIFKPVVDLPDYISSSGHGCFDYFFGASPDNEDGAYSLLWAIEAYKDRMPVSLLPLGGDVGGGVVCLGISGEQHGKIYYWDPGNEWDLDDLEEGDDVAALKFQNVHLIASDFSSFISSLDKSPYA